MMVVDGRDKQQRTCNGGHPWIRDESRSNSGGTRWLMMINDGKSRFMVVGGS